MDEVELEDDEILLPPPDEQTTLLEQLADLVESQGFEQLVSAPLVEPNERFFPDPWRGGEASVRRLARRLLGFCGIDEVEIEIMLHEDEPGTPSSPRLEDNAWFREISTKAFVFDVRTAVLREPSSLVPTMARAVAHAYREAHELPTKDGTDPLIDVTTVYLGFGLLTTDTSLRHESGAAGGFRSNRRQVRLGQLSPHAMSFLLAVWARARSLDRKGRRAIASKLQSNQAGFFAEAHSRVTQLGLVDRLKLPPQKDWPEPASVTQLTRLVSVDDAEPEEPRDLDKGIEGMNEGKPVFRVEQNMALKLAKLLGLPIMVIGGFMSRTIPDMGFGMQQVALVAVAGAAAGFLVGSFIRDVRCSEPKCTARLTAVMGTCPRCGGTIMGAIKHPRERLAAEEKLARAGTGTEPPGQEP